MPARVPLLAHASIPRAQWLFVRAPVYAFLNSVGVPVHRWLLPNDRPPQHQEKSSTELVIFFVSENPCCRFVLRRPSWYILQVQILYCCTPRPTRLLFYAVANPLDSLRPESPCASV